MPSIDDFVKANHKKKFKFGIIAALLCAIYWGVWYVPGYAVWEEVRRRCLAAGRKVLIMAEDGAERRFAFDMEQDGVLWYADRDRGGQYRDPVNFYLEKLDIVDSVKTGQGIGSADAQRRGEGGRYRFYTCCVSNHDYQRSAVNLNRLALGYHCKG